MGESRAAVPAAQTGARILYLAGWGRSGTTILENILDAYEGVFSAGELHYLWQRGFIEGRRCGCGLVLAKCPLWTEVLRVAYGARPPDPAHVVSLQRRALRVRHTKRLGAGSLDPAAEEYRDLLTRLYLGVARVTGARLIVDSSKLPSAAALLARMGPRIDGYLMHMVRDPRAVAYSWNRVTPQPDRVDRVAILHRHGPLRSTAHWLVWNRLSERVGRTYPGARYRRLRYEDFVIDPYGTVSDILEFTGLAGQGVSTKDGPFLNPTTVRLGGNHTVSGNPRRFHTGDTPIRQDDAWRWHQPAVPRFLVSLAALPMHGRYGYPAWISTSPETADAGAIVYPQPVPVVAETETALAEAVLTEAGLVEALGLEPSAGPDVGAGPRRTQPPPGTTPVTSGYNTGVRPRSAQPTPEQAPRSGVRSETGAKGRSE